MNGSKMTHLALHISNLDRSIGFYTRFTDMKVVHERFDKETNMRTAWLSDRNKGHETEFVIVLLEGTPPQFPAAKPQAALAPLSHIGIALPTREDVDRIAEKGRDAGTLRFGPVYLNEIIGYICLLADPDGHQLEFSYGQVNG